MLISAGIARRMYPLTRETPKCLLRIHDDLTILDIQLCELKKIPVQKIYIIVGFKAKMISDYVSKNYPELPIEFIYNPFFEVSNNLASVWLALKNIRTDLITINGDDVFSIDIIAKLIKAKGDIVVTLSQKNSYDDDDMKVRLHNGILTDIGKTIIPSHADAESIGIIKYTQKGLALFKETLDSLIEANHGAINMFYLEAIDDLAKRTSAIKTTIVDQSQWYEFDFPEDIETIKRNIFENKTSIDTLRS